MHASPENAGKPSVRKKEELHTFDRIAAHFFFFFSFTQPTNDEFR